MATYTVINTADSGAGSLRQAVLDANATVGVADEIVFDAAVLGAITLATQLNLYDDTTVTGPGADLLTVSLGAGAAFNMEKAGGNFVVSGLTFSGASVTSYAVIIQAGANGRLSGVAITGNNTTTAAIYIQGAGTTVIENSVISGNVSAQIGGIYLQQATLNLVNTTISGNTGQTVGALVSSDGATANLRNATVAGNARVLVGVGNTGGLAATATGALNLANTIVAGNTGGDIELDGTASATANYSLIQVPGAAVYGGANNLTGVDPLLGPLQNNGGRIQTRLPGAASPVINAGDPAFAPPPAFDARGLARVLGGRLDLGAVEVQPVAGGGVLAEPTPPAPPPSVAPTLNANFSHLTRYLTYGSTPPLPATVTTPEGKELPNPFLAQQAAIRAVITKVDAGQMTLRAAQDQVIDMADGTTSVATLSYQFFTGKIPTKAGLDYLVSSPENPRDLNDGFYAGMSLENRYINFAVNLGKVGEGRADFAAQYGSLSLADATAKAYLEIFGKAADAAKLAAILTPERSSYFLSLGGDALGQKAAMVGFLLGEAAKTDTGPYAVMNENFLYDLVDGVAAYGTDLHIYLGAGPRTVGLVGQPEAELALA